MEKTIPEAKKMQMINESSPAMDKIYKICIEKLELTVNEVLKEAGVGRYEYNNLCRNFLSVGAYRKLKLGRSKKLTEEHKSKLRFIRPSCTDKTEK